MRLFSMKSRAFINNSVLDWGSAAQIEVWQNWSNGNPQMRCGPDDPIDDGTGPMPSDLRDVIVDCLHKRFDFLIKTLHRPGIGEDEAADIGNDASLIYGIACSVLGSKLAW